MGRGCSPPWCGTCVGASLQRGVVAVSCPQPHPALQGAAADGPLFAGSGMHSWGGGFQRPMGEGPARVPTPACPWQPHDRQPALNHGGFLAGHQCSGGMGRRERLPARSLAPDNFHRLAARNSVRGESNPGLKRPAAGSGVPLSLGLAAT
jgi:hypothetical protein